MVKKQLNMKHGFKSLDKNRIKYHKKKQVLSYIMYLLGLFALLKAKSGR